MNHLKSHDNNNLYSPRLKRQSLIIYKNTIIPIVKQNASIYVLSDIVPPIKDIIAINTLISILLLDTIFQYG